MIINKINIKIKLIIEKLISIHNFNPHINKNKKKLFIYL